MRLRWQLALTLAALAAAAAIAGSLAAYRSTSHELEARTDAFLTRRLEEITNFNAFIESVDLDDLFDTAELDTLLGAEFASRFGPAVRGQGPFGDDERRFRGDGFPFARPDANTVFLNSDGSQRLSLAAVDLPVSDDERALAATGSGKIVRDVTIDGRRYRVLTAPLQPGNSEAGAVQIARDTTEAHDVLAELVWQLAAITAVVTTAAAAVGWALARRLATPLERLRSAAAGVAETKDFAVRLPETERGEVAELTSSFNSMLTELETSRRQQHQLVQDANHELRTPLATLSANIELLQQFPSDAPEREAILADAARELPELTDLTQQLVSAASVQYDVATRTEMPLDQLVDAAVDQFRARSPREVNVTYENPQTVAVTPNVATRALLNILANADKFAPPSTPIEIDISTREIRIRDHGPGIPDADLPHIFDKFYRADTSRTLPGSGLGLALVKQIVDDHNGTVTAINHPAGGTAITIGFPNPPNP